MAKLIGCLNVFDGMQFLPDCLDSWIPHLDYLIAVDGAYRGFPAVVPASTDGTLEYLEEIQKQFPDWLAIKRATGFWENQEVKRTAYLRESDKIAQPGDWLIQVDDDEEIVWCRGLKEFLEEQPLHVECVYLGITNGPDGPLPPPDHWGKCYRWTPGMYYGREHWMLHRADGQLVWGTDPPPYGMVKTDALTFRHWTDQRDRVRLNDKSKFQDHLADQRRRHGCSNPSGGQ